MKNKIEILVNGEPASATVKRAVESKIAEKASGERTQHTPGPWLYEEQHDIDEDENGYRWAITASTREEREGGSRSWPKEGYRQNPAYANNEANARLIAAAPELLGACRSALRALNDNLAPGPMDEDAKQALRVVIAQAEGRQS